jgi:hypothetical protein
MVGLFVGVRRVGLNEPVNDGGVTWGKRMSNTENDVCVWESALLEFDAIGAPYESA